MGINLEHLRQRKAMSKAVKRFKKLAEMPNNIYPINTSIILKKLGVTLIIKGSGYDSTIEIVNDDDIEFSISERVYKDKDALRQELALLFGHYVLHLVVNMHNDKETKKYDFPKRKSWKAERQEAELFAHQLLMPSEDFCDEIDKNNKNGLVDLKKVASNFGVNFYYAKRWAEELKVIQYRL